MKAPALAPWPCSTSGFSRRIRRGIRAHTTTSVGMRFAVNGDAVHAELEARRDLGQRRLGAFAAGQAVGDDADMMAAVGLAVGEIEDMAENSADRRAHRVQDTKRLVVKLRHDQNQRSDKRACRSHADRACAAEHRAKMERAARAPRIEES